MDQFGQPDSPPDAPHGWPVQPGERPPSREGGWQPSDPPTAQSWPHTQELPNTPPHGAPPPMPPRPAPSVRPAAPPSPPRAGRSRVGLGFLAGLLVALLVGGVGFAIGRDASTTKTVAADTSPAPQPVKITPAAPGTVDPAEAVAKALSPAVVQIETDQGLGSGFIYDTDGHILTASARDRWRQVGPGPTR